MVSPSLFFDFDFLGRDDGLDDGGWLNLGWPWSFEWWFRGNWWMTDRKKFILFGIFCASRSSFWIRQRIYLGFRERIKINWDWCLFIEIDGLEEESFGNLGIDLSLLLRVVLGSRFRNKGWWDWIVDKIEKILLRKDFYNKNCSTTLYIN